MFFIIAIAWRVLNFSSFYYREAQHQTFSPILCHFKVLEKMFDVELRDNKRTKIKYPPCYSNDEKHYDISKLIVIVYYLT